MNVGSVLAKTRW